MSTHSDDRASLLEIVKDLAYVPQRERWRLIHRIATSPALTRKERHDVVIYWWTLFGESGVGELGPPRGFRLVKLFREAGFISDVEGSLAPVESTQVFRGCAVGAARRCSWTTDFDTAKRFAAIHRDWLASSRVTIYSATIPPEGVLAVFSASGESEIVVDPRLLANVRIIARVKTN